MSFDQLLLNRPQYSPTHKHHPFTLHSHNPTPFSITTQISPIESPRFKDLVTVPKSLERGHLYDKLKASIKQHEEAKSIQTGIKNTKVREAYNLLSDFNDKKQIIQSLKQLNTADERIMLIDKILERKEEMQIANLRLKAKKLEPIFNVIRRKLKKQQKLNVSHGKLKKQSTILEKLHETTNNEVQNPMTSYRNLDEVQDETSRQEQVIEKIQNKYTTTIAFSWLTGRNEKQESAAINLSPEAIKRHNRRNTTLQLSHKGITGLKQMVTKKVSENSEEMIRLGQLKLQESAIKNYNSKDIIAKSKPKVDTGRKKSASNCTMLRKKQTLAFVSNERKENSALNQKLANENSNIMFRRRLIDGK